MVRKKQNCFHMTLGTVLIREREEFQIFRNTKKEFLELRGNFWLENQLTSML